MVFVVMIGATGAVGGHALRQLLAMDEVTRVTTLGRRATGFQHPKLHDHVVDLTRPEDHVGRITGHDVAVCTLGVGEPSKASREEFLSIDHDLPLAFAQSCRTAGVPAFVLLSSVGTDARSRSFYLRTKGRLEDGLRTMGFQGLSLFHPSVILTPTNRYGLSQAIVNSVWPRLTPVLAGPLRKLRGIPVDVLGKSIAATCTMGARGVEVLEWDAIRKRAQA